MYSTRLHSRKLLKGTHTSLNQTYFIYLKDKNLFGLHKRWAFARTSPDDPQGILIHTSNLPHTLPESTYPQACVCSVITFPAFCWATRLDLLSSIVWIYASLLIACPAVQENAFSVHLVDRQNSRYFQFTQITETTTISGINNFCWRLAQCKMIWKNGTSWEPRIFFLERHTAIEVFKLNFLIL